MRISDWSSDVCSSDRADVAALVNKMKTPPATQPNQAPQTASRTPPAAAPRAEGPSNPNLPVSMSEKDFIRKQVEDKWQFDLGARDAQNLIVRSEENTSELKSLMRISYAVFCLKKKKQKIKTRQTRQINKK